MLMWGLGTGGINKWNMMGGVQGGRLREQLHLEINVNILTNGRE